MFRGFFICCGCVGLFVDVVTVSRWKGGRVSREAVDGLTAAAPPRCPSAHIQLAPQSLDAKNNKTISDKYINISGCVTFVSF